MRIDGRRQRGAQRVPAVLAMTIAVIAVSAAPATAKVARVSDRALSVGPANPLGSKPIVVRWFADRAPRADRGYQVEVRIDGEGGRCRSFAEDDLTPTWKKGATVTATLRPTRTKGTREWWCTGKGAVRVVAKSGGSLTPLARRLFEVRDDPSSPTPTDPVGTPVSIDLLAGSLMTVKVTGRPDRSAALSGTLRGFLPGKFRPNTDLRQDSITGTVTVSGMPADPLCAANGRSMTTTFDVDRASSLVLRASGLGFFALLPSEELLGVAGCQGPAPAATRALALTGKVGPAGLVQFRMDGSIGDVTLSDGAVASISLTLVTKIDLSGK